MRIDSRWMQLAARLSASGILTALLSWGGYRLGELGDAHFHTAPLCAGVGCLVGASLGLAWIIAVAVREKP